MVFLVLFLDCWKPYFGSIILLKQDYQRVTVFTEIRPSIFALVALFLYTLKRPNNSLFSKAEAISSDNNFNFICKQGKLSGKMQQNLK